jgi:hypothetical protein
MAKHEQSVADEFNNFLQEQAKKLGATFHPFSLDGQDRDAGADYLITKSSRFALIEFKYEISDINKEKKKKRRLNLCKQLEIDPKMRLLHDKCHFIACLQSPDLKLIANIYRLEVCNASIFGKGHNLSMSSPRESNRISAEKFADEFFNNSNSRNISLQEFEIYLAWLLQNTSSSSQSSLELACRDPKANTFSFVTFASVRAANDWLIQNKP